MDRDLMVIDVEIMLDDDVRDKLKDFLDGVQHDFDVRFISNDPQMIQSDNLAHAIGSKPDDQKMAGMLWADLPSVVDVLISDHETTPLPVIIHMRSHDAYIHAAVDGASRFCEAYPDLRSANMFEHNTAFFQQKIADDRTQVSLEMSSLYEAPEVALCAAFEEACVIEFCDHLTAESELKVYDRRHSLEHFKDTYKGLIQSTALMDEFNRGPYQDEVYLIADEKNIDRSIADQVVNSASDVVHQMKRKYFM